MFEELGARRSAMMSAQWESYAASSLGQEQQALETARRHLERTRASGVQWTKYWGELAWAFALTMHGDPAQALASERAALAYYLEAGDQWGALLAVQFRSWSLARIITDQLTNGHPDRARLRALAKETAQLIGGAKTLRRELGAGVAAMGPFGDETARTIDVARGVLGTEAYDAAEKQGILLRPESQEVQRLALGTLPLPKTAAKHPTPTAGPSHWSLLTVTEQEVAILAAAGWTNAGIALRRGISSRTVDAQIAAVLHKLTVTSRKDIIAFVPNHQIDRVRDEAAKRPRPSRERRGPRRLR